MENISIQELINAVRGEFIVGDPHAAVGSVSIDTRTMRRGDFYVALSGRNFDGHAFVRQAIEKEAAGIIVSRGDLDLGNPFPVFPAVIRVQDTMKALGELAAYYRGRWRGTLVGVTGSNGKTTTKEMLSSILGRIGPTLSNAGNLNNQIGVPLTLFNLSSQHRYAVIEMGTSLPGEIPRLAAIAAPSVGVITNIGYSHLENLKSLEGVFAEKRALFDRLDANGWAVVNADDPYLSTVTAGRFKTVTYGMSRTAEVRAENINLSSEFPRFTLCLGGLTADIRLPVFGRFNVYNAIAAAAAASRLGIDIDVIKQGLENFSSPRMRMETTTLENGVTLINDAYNANPSSLRASVTGIIQTFPHRQKLLVLGDMLELGEESEKEHARLGEFLSGLPVAGVLLFGPRMARASETMSTAGFPVRHFVRKEELTLELRRMMNPGSVVFFKGSRGMKLEEAVAALQEETE